MGWGGVRWGGVGWGEVGWGGVGWGGVGILETRVGTSTPFKKTATLPVKNFEHKTIWSPTVVPHSPPLAAASAATYARKASTATRLVLPTLSS